MRRHLTGPESAAGRSPAPAARTDRSGSPAHCTTDGAGRSGAGSRGHGAVLRVRLSPTSPCAPEELGERLGPGYVVMQTGEADVVILDTPDVGDVQALRRVSPRALVLVAVAPCDTAHVIAALDAGADDAVAWPCASELAARVRALVRRREQWS